MELNKLHEEYERIRPQAQYFITALKEQVEALLSHNNILLGVPLESRLKDWDSIRTKIDLKGLKLNSVMELGDLIGLRVILLFNRDLQKLLGLIDKNFTILEKEDASYRLGETQFGYQSVHYVVKLPKEWLAIPSFKEFYHFKAELQVRTLSQHIWAAASHRLQYKQESSVPPAVRRSLHRVSALLETVDLELERVLQDRDSYLVELKRGKSEEPLNVDLIAELLDSRLPARNKNAPYEDYSALLTDLEHLGIKTSDQLVELIDNQLNNALQSDANIVKKMQERKVGFGGSGVQERLAKGVFLSYVGLVREMLSLKFGATFSVRPR